jgi:hypothetical protein
MSQLQLEQWQWSGGTAILFTSKVALNRSLEAPVVTHPVDMVYTHD